MTRREFRTTNTLNDFRTMQTIRQETRQGTVWGTGRGFRAAAVAAALAMVLFAPVRATAQSTMTSACVGGSAGCNQVDFTFALPAGSSTTFDFFRLTITGGTWRFTSAQPGSVADAVGFTFFTPAVTGSGTVLTGHFDPGFEPLADPFVQLRAQFVPNSNTNTSSLAYSYEVGTGGQTVYRGIGVAVTATPEPSGLLLLASGLMGVGGAVVRRKRAA
jgi:hypothetical protein